MKKMVYSVQEVPYSDTGAGNGCTRVLSFIPSNVQQSNLSSGLVECVQCTVRQSFGGAGYGGVYGVYCTVP